MAQDPFFLVKRSHQTGFLHLSQEKPEELVSALLLAEGKIPRIILGSSEVSSETVPGFPTEWIFLTSGSTGKPKQVHQRLAAIIRMQSKNNLGMSTWGFLTDSTRMAGIQVIIEALLRNETLVIPGVESTLNEKIAFFTRHNVSHLAATPSQWRQILSNSNSKNLKLKQITLGGEISDGKVLKGLKHRFPESQITHIYATTETGSIFAVKDCLPGFPSTELSKPGSRLRLSNCGELGVFIPNKNMVHWTGDLVHRVGDRYQFVGRNSDVINVGGAKVLPAEVELILLQHPDVSDCIVRGTPNSILGNLVVAEIVLEARNENIKSELKELSSLHLPKYAIPRVITIVEEIPRNQAGKKAR